MKFNETWVTEMAARLAAEATALGFGEVQVREAEAGTVLDAAVVRVSRAARAARRN